MPIFEQGYQHWSGTLAGHSWRWLAITKHGIRVALRNKWLRRAVRLSWLPAFGLAGVLCLWGLLEQKSDWILSYKNMLGFLFPDMIVNPRTYRMEVWTLSFTFFMITELYFSMILILIMGPDLISQDLRYNALPLYLSRPLRRIDYFFGKLGVIFAFLTATTIGPATLAYVLGILFSADLSTLRDTFPLFLGSLAYGLVISISAGTLILALSSLSRNSRYIALMWLGVWLVTATVSGFLTQIDREQRVREGQFQGYGFMSPEFVESDVKDSQTNWRPLVSYTGNLYHIGRQLLGTDRAWDKLSSLVPGGQQDVWLWQYRGAQYPWTWSAAVLIVVFAISAFILNGSIKSLDRLK